METKTMIGIKLRVEGVHYFPKADEIAGFEVNYLKSFHRHNFGIECTMEVNHDNRDVEFIMLKHRVEEYLHGKYFDQNYRCLNFKAMSCEMIAKELLKEFGFCYVKVDEDDENYAEVFVTLKDEDEQPANQTSKSNLKRISFIVGKFCSGKSYYAQKLSEEGNKRGYHKEWGFIEIGDIVRDITKTNERTIDPALDKEIVNKVIELVESEGCESEELFITGIRQLSVFKKLYEEFVSKGYEMHIHYLPTSREMRKKFFKEQKQRNPKKNLGKSFEELEKDERKLGVDQLCSYLVDEFVKDDNFHFINVLNF